MRLTPASVPFSESPNPAPAVPIRQNYVGSTPSHNTSYRTLADLHATLSRACVFSRPVHYVVGGVRRDGRAISHVKLRLREQIEGRVGGL